MLRLHLPNKEKRKEDNYYTEAKVGIKLHFFTRAGDTGREIIGEDTMSNLECQGCLDS